MGANEAVALEANFESWKAAIHEWAVDGSTVKIDFRGYEGIRQQYSRIFDRVFRHR